MSEVIRVRSETKKRLAEHCHKLKTWDEFLLELLSYKIMEENKTPKMKIK